MQVEWHEPWRPRDAPRALFFGGTDAVDRKEHDRGQPAAAHPRALAAADGGQRLPAALHRGGYGHRRPRTRPRGAGGVGRGGLVQLDDALHRSGAGAGLLRAHGAAVWRGGRRGSAAHHRQRMLALGHLRRGAHRRRSAAHALRAARAGNAPVHRRYLACLHTHHLLGPAGGHGLQPLFCYPPLRGRWQDAASGDDLRLRGQYLAGPALRGLLRYGRGGRGHRHGHRSGLLGAHLPARPLAQRSHPRRPGGPAPGRPALPAPDGAGRAGGGAEHGHLRGRHDRAARGQQLRRRLRGRIYRHQQALRRPGDRRHLLWLRHDRLRGAEPRRIRLWPHPPGRARRRGGGGADLGADLRGDAALWQIAAFRLHHLAGRGRGRAGA